MTIKLRERLFWIFFIMASLALVGTIALLWAVGADGIEGVLSVWNVDFTSAAFYTVIGAAGMSGIFAAAACGLIAFKSGRTVSVEIFFFSLWAFCRVFALAKIGALAFGPRIPSPVAYELVTRVALFGRYCGVMALFAGSLFAAGLKQERGLPVFFAVLMASLFFSSVHPLNSSGPGTDLLVDRGIPSLSRAFELFMVTLAFIDYLLAWKSTRGREFLIAGISAAACFAAASVVDSTMSPSAAIVSFIAMAAAASAFLRTMHEYYLWR